LADDESGQEWNVGSRASFSAGIARAEGGDTASNLFNGPCHIKTKHCREELLGMRCFARADFGVKRIHAAGRDPDQNLIHPERRARKLYLPKLSTWPFNEPNFLPHHFLL
jgi:hypothetical protein